MKSETAEQDAAGELRSDAMCSFTALCVALFDGDAMSDTEALISR